MTADGVVAFQVTVAAVMLSVVQLVPHYLPELGAHRRRRLLSMTAGFGVGYVFLYLLPEVAAYTETLAAPMGDFVPFTKQYGHFLTLLGVVVFYGLERFARVGGARLGSRVFRSQESRVATVVISAFALYYALIGYLLWHQPGPRDLAVFALAMGLHFLGADVGLREHHRDFYAGAGHWILACAVIVGWGAGALTTVPPGALAGMLSLVAGGVILVALREELPPERDGRWLPFAAGAVGAALVL